MVNFDKIKRLYTIDSTPPSVGYQEEELIQLEKRLEIKLPETLRTYYLTLGKNEAINYTHNRLLKLDEIGFSVDNYLVFYEENQVVVYWGIKREDLKLTNPPVWGNWGTSDLPDWQVETQKAANFFLLMAVYNGTLGGLKYNANRLDRVDSEIVKKVQKNWKEVTEISWDKQKVYSNNFEKVLSLCFDEAGNCTAIFVGTNSKEQFDHLLRTLNIDWSYISYEEEA